MEHATLQRRDNSSRDHHRRLQEGLRYRTSSLARTISVPGSGILTGFPFGQLGSIFFRKNNRKLLTEFTVALGPTHPCSTAVHMEPFSTSVLEVLARVFATTTKICTDSGSRQAHARKPSTPPPRPSYSLQLDLLLLLQRPSIGQTL